MQNLKLTIIPLFALLFACQSAPQSPYPLYNSPWLSGDQHQIAPYAQDNISFSRPKRAVKNSPPRKVEVEPAKTTPKPKKLNKATKPKTITTKAKKKQPTQRSPQIQHASHYVWAMYKLNKSTLDEKHKKSITSLYKQCRKKKKVYHTTRPQVGDIVFFHNVFDANNDGRNNDWFTHIGLVEKIHNNGRINVLHFQKNSVRRSTMNLDTPDAHKLKGQVQNSKLRTPQKSDLRYTRYLSGQLFAGFCSLLGSKEKFDVIDNWTPQMKLPNK